MNVTLVFSAGGTAYGPITETWTIAQGRLTGTVYYNSYGTNLAHNYCCTIRQSAVRRCDARDQARRVEPRARRGEQHRVPCVPFGERGWITARHPARLELRVVILVRPEDLCRDGDDAGGDGRLRVAGDVPRWEHAPVRLGAARRWLGRCCRALLRLDRGIGHVDGVAFGAQGRLPGLLARRKAHRLQLLRWVGHGRRRQLNADKVSLAAMDYDPMTSTFSNFRILYTPPGGHGGVAVVLPDERCRGVRARDPEQRARLGRDAFDVRLERHVLELRYAGGALVGGPRDADGGASRLAQRPRLPADADGDGPHERRRAQLRADGQPRRVRRLRVGRLHQPAPVRQRRDASTRSAAIRGPRPQRVSPRRRSSGSPPSISTRSPGTDPSHPAFYLPAQELLAGNSRGFWVVDPCKADGTRCETGDECCGGYCEDTDGGFVCTNLPPTCSSIGEKCTTTSDCCGASAASSASTASAPTRRRCNAGHARERWA